jgi:hypothetical protein
MQGWTSSKQKIPLLAILTAVTAIATSLAARADHTQHGAHCNLYASKAAEQQRRNVNSNCGYTGPAWSFDRKAHYNWCMTLTDAPYFRATSIEKGNREKALKKCNAGPDTTGGGSIGGKKKDEPAKRMDDPNAYSEPAEKCRATCLRDAMKLSTSEQQTAYFNMCKRNKGCE